MIAYILFAAMAAMLTLALFLHEREDRVLRGRPFGETGRHRRREERTSR